MRTTTNRTVVREISAAARALDHMGAVLSKAHVLAEERLLSEATAFEVVLTRLGVLNLRQALNLAPIDVEAVTDDRIRTFLAELQFESAHHAMEALRHVDEIRPSLERLFQARLMVRIATVSQHAAYGCRDQLRNAIACLKP